MPEQLPTCMLPTSVNHCGVCAWETELERPTNTNYERTAQQLTLKVCVKDELSLVADQRVITPGDSLRANNRLDVCRRCASMIISGDCPFVEARAVNQNVVFLSKKTASSDRPRLRSV